MASVSSRLPSQLLRKKIFRESLRRFLVTAVNIDKEGSLPTSVNVQTFNRSPSKHCLCGNVINRHGVVGLRHHRYFSDTRHHRYFSDTRHHPDESDPFQALKPEINSLCEDINKTFETESDELRQISQYYFDGKGKLFRPRLVMLMAKALNQHISNSDRLLPSQQRVAMIAEMIHTASLIHDDVIDQSKTRRGKATVDAKWGQKKAIAAGDYILSISSIQLARIGNKDVVQILSQVIDDLVRGEFLQLGSKENAADRFNHYLEKTFKKTASLVANSCKAVAVLGGCDADLTNLAYQCGRHIGLAFQFVDDLLDFTSCDNVMGKPTAADLKLGLATAPVLFAAQDFEELNPMIMRRFSQEGDVERARELVAMSNGVQQTKTLAEKHCKEAVRLISQLQPSTSREGLVKIANFIISRQS